MINKIRLKNWQSHIDTEMDFSKGINALVGVIGSGKSSVLEAISFAFFGTFPAAQQRRIRLENVITDLFTSKDSCSVELEFEKDGKTYEISRTIERNKGTTHSHIKCEGNLIEAPSTQRVTERIESIIGIDYTLFSQVVYCEQNRLDQFLQIPKGQRMRRIDDLLKIDRFEVARKNIVTLKNRLSSKKKDIERNIASMEDILSSKNKDKLKKDIEDQKATIQAFSRRLDEVKKERDSLKESIGKMEKKRSVHESYEKKGIELKSNIRHIEKELSGYKNTSEVSSYSIEFIEKQIARLKKAKGKNDVSGREISALEERIGKLKKDIRQHDKRLGELQDKMPLLKRIPLLRKEIEELDKSYEAKNVVYAGTRSSIDEEKKAIDSLRKASSLCPTCDSYLDDAKRENMIKKKMQRKKDLEDKLSLMIKEKEDISSKRKDKQKSLDECLKYSGIEDDIKNIREQKRISEKGLEESEKKHSGLISAYDPKKGEKIDSEIRRFDRTKDILRMVGQKRDLEERLKQNRINIEQLGFDKEDYERTKDSYYRTDKLYSTDLERVSSLKNSYKEKVESLEMIDKQSQLMNKERKRSARIDTILPELESFKRALESTQIMLRERFVESINDLMSGLWTSIYPYSDYTSCNLSVSEGDYILQICDMDGKWINVEGTVSGGERTSAILVLRIAMCLVLAPNMRIMLLDEPTHNLDTRAVSDLARTLADKISGIMDQAFLITHDEAMESAVTGKLYRLERGPEKKDITHIEKAI